MPHYRLTHRALWTALAWIAAAAVAPAEFKPSSPAAEGVPVEAVQRLDALIQKFVDDEEVVGAELLLIKNGRSILHKGYGWRDREAQTRMAPGGVFCVRSMTKPMIAAAVLMLVEEGKLSLDDHAAKYLPSFDVEGSRAITIRHLLEHSSGLPLSLILGKDLKALHQHGGIRAVADLGGGYALQFEPGTNFEYSDQGVDTLTAIIERVTGAPAAEFVTKRLLAPLGMKDSTCVMSEGHPLRARAVSKYAGQAGAWTRFWSANEPPLFPFLLGSQGMYATLEDYARFLQMWRVAASGAPPLLAPESVRVALRPNPYRDVFSTALPGLQADYGHLMQLWLKPAEENKDAPSRALVAYGHSGSDGTWAWAFPEQDALALYFTQSRGNTTGLRIEATLAAVFLGAPLPPTENVAVAPGAGDFGDYLGYYRKSDGDPYRAVIRDGDRLALEAPGRQIVRLSRDAGDVWRPDAEPGTRIEFVRSAGGEVTGMRVGEQPLQRFTPAADLPTVAELVERVERAHRLGTLEQRGALRVTGTIEIPRLGMTGTNTTVLVWPDRFYVCSDLGGSFEAVSFDGTTVRYASTAAPPVALAGESAAALRVDHALAHFGDWRRFHERLTVVQRITQGDDEYFLVRSGGTDAPATTFYVQRDGRVVRVDSMTHLPMLGRVGQRVKYDDFREVAGLLLPHRTTLDVANPMAGVIEMTLTVTDVELGVKWSDDEYSLVDAGDGGGADDADD